LCHTHRPILNIFEVHGKNQFSHFFSNAKPSNVSKKREGPAQLLTLRSCIRNLKIAKYLKHQLILYGSVNVNGECRYCSIILSVSGSSKTQGQRFECDNQRRRRPTSRYVIFSIVYYNIVYLL